MDADKTQDKTQVIYGQKGCNEWCEIGDKGHGYYYAEPIWAWNPVNMEATFYRGMTSCDGLRKAGFTHWKRAYPPEEGPRVLTQEERDEEAYTVFCCTKSEPTHADAFLAGAKYAREAVRKS